MLDNLLRLISDIVDKKLYEYGKGKPRMWVVRIITASVAPNGMASVYVNGDTASTPISLKNKSFETLVANNEAYALSPSGSLSDAVILYRK
jgi:hypothetical protein